MSIRPGSERDVAQVDLGRRDSAAPPGGSRRRSRLPVDHDHRRRTHRAGLDVDPPLGPQDRSLSLIELPPDRIGNGSARRRSWSCGASRGQRTSRRAGTLCITPGVVPDDQVAHRPLVAVDAVGRRRPCQEVGRAAPCPRRAHADDMVRSGADHERTASGAVSPDERVLLGPASLASGQALREAGPGAPAAATLRTCGRCAALPTASFSVVAADRRRPRTCWRTPSPRPVTGSRAR